MTENSPLRIERNYWRSEAKRLKQENAALKNTCKVWERTVRRLQEEVILHEHKQDAADETFLARWLLAMHLSRSVGGKS